MNIDIKYQISLILPSFLPFCESYLDIYIYIYIYNVTDSPFSKNFVKNFFGLNHHNCLQYVKVHKIFHFQLLNIAKFG